MAEVPETAPRPHLAHVEGLRAAAALMVFLNHAFAQTWITRGTPAPEFPLSLFRYSMATGHFSVSLFIAISGFCLALPVVKNQGMLKGGPLAFFRRRARRILPPYYAALLLSLALIGTIIGKPTGTLWDVPIVVDKEAIVSHALLMQDFFRTGRINYAFWSIAVEWHIYFLFPGILLAMRRFGSFITTGVLGTLGLTLALAFWDTRLGRANLHYVGIFCLGVVATHIAYGAEPAWARLRAWPHWPKALIASFLATWAGLLAIGIPVPDRLMPILDVGVALTSFATLIWTSRTEDHAFRRILRWKPLCTLGTFSYSFYLIHAPMLQICWQFGTRPLGLSPSLTFGALCTLGLAATILVAWVFFWLVERPFLSAPPSNPR